MSALPAGFGPRVVPRLRGCPPARAVDLTGQSETGVQLARHDRDELRKQAFRPRPGACRHVEGEGSEDVPGKDPEPLAERLDVVVKPGHALGETLEAAEHDAFVGMLAGQVL